MYNTKATITDDTPVVMITLGQLKEALKNEPQPEPVQHPVQQSTNVKYVYGIHGIRKLFNVAHSTAQRYKNTFLKDAVMQNGKKIVVDVDKALELFSKWEG
jgi:hypothetical protein